MTNFLYNTKYNKDSAVEIRTLKAKAIMINGSANLARIESNNTLSYNVTAHTTGIADLKYRQTLPANNNRGRITINEGDGRYYGTFDTIANINMTLPNFARAFKPKNVSDDDEGWLPCCPNPLPIEI